VPTPAGQLTQAVSRKTHGAAGTFDVYLPVVGTRGIEPRSGGPNGDHTVVFTFSNPVVSVGGATTSGGTVSSSGPGVNSREYVVNLTGVPNAQNVVVSLNGVVDSTGAAAGPVTVTMGVLLGDTTGNGTVNASDLSETKSRSGSTTDGSNFRNDVTVNGAINSSDVGMVKASSGALVADGTSGDAVNHAAK
jgi:hypothetical protein